MKLTGEQEHKILLTLKDVATGHYSPEDGANLVLSDLEKVAEEDAEEKPEPSEAEKKFRGLIDEILTYDSSIMCPKNPMGPGESPLVNVEDEFLRKTFSLALLLARERDRNRLEGAYETNPDDKSHLMRVAQVSGEKANLLFLFFWAYVRESAEIFDQRMLAVRAGWQIVTFEAPQRPPTIFEYLFGGPGGPAGHE